MGTASFEGFGLRIVVASDKFKGTLTSAEVAEAVGTGVRRVCPDATVIPVPVADGGDGTLSAAVAAGYTLVPITASGPTGEPVLSGYARLGNTAVVELADVSGLVHLPGGTPAPLTATSYGTGELISAAIDAGCTRIILGIGGSASTDGGQGLIQALARRPDRLSGNNSALRDEKLPKIGAGPPSPPAAGGGPASSAAASGAAASSPAAGGVLGLAALRRRLRGVKLVVACDVDNPLTGPRGAAAVYGPQKGATPAQVAELDARLGKWADLVARATGADLRDTPGAGAAGGVGFAAIALLGAELRPGIDLILEMVRFSEQLAGADLVVTGEGALDEQTLHGKAVAGVAAAARAGGGPTVGRPTVGRPTVGRPTVGRPAVGRVAAGAGGVPVVAVCGVNRLSPEQLRGIGVAAAYALTDVEPDVQRCIAEPRPLLEELGERIAVEHLTMTRTERGIA
ncbi:glycerate kinase [Kribbella aluminosa]|uniref:Glycerate kinase n=1 Tax=Kribbella aluminosa TaxID=416017 RepID=A0ABS4UR86_9ACTN|nr:glycerate kinase [Kribbella aluminosa]MBP2354154.1 glycerate kinase [Kribbella aluminosa]